MGSSALKGALVNAPSEPAPVVEGDFPVILDIYSMNNSGSSMWCIGLKTHSALTPEFGSDGLFLRPGRIEVTGLSKGELESCLR